MNELKYSEILRLNNEFESNNKGLYKISLLSNVMVHQGKEIIEYLLRSSGINANIELGNYDNIAQESQKKNDSTIIFWEVFNIVDGLQYDIELLTKDEINAIEYKVKSEIEFVVNNLKNCPIVIINKFTPLMFSYFCVENDRLAYLADMLNRFLEECIMPNIRLVSLDRIISKLGIDNSFDLRYYYSSKAPYTVSFFKAYAQYVKPFFMSINGMSKKALIFDCDNTLWKGIVGEDGVNGIEMSIATKDGAIFHEVQSIALSLSRQGVIIGLCSKNNLDDVNEILNCHPSMILRDDCISIKMINWSDKVKNLRIISEKLNISLDSIVFIDDSSFEVELIKKQLPDVTVLQVPEKLYNFPKLIRENFNLFYMLSNTVEDAQKVKSYREQKKREDIKKEFFTMDDYLKSLELKIIITINDKLLISRIAQLTQKTNQFNLNTKRYTEVEIRNMILSSKIDIYSLSVKDRFGDSGVTGVCIVNKFEDNTCIINNFLLSCRIIGRNIEYVFMDYIVNSLAHKGIVGINSAFTKTMKNAQVEFFFDNCSFSLKSKNENEKCYYLSIDKYKKSRIKYIKVVDYE
mgnify:CR=1 FL=1